MTTLPVGRAHRVLTRRSVLLGSASVLAVGTLAGCASSEEPAAEEPAADAGGAGSAGAGDTVTFEGAQGAVELPRRPRRVVSIYPTDSDIALALGLTLVAAPGATGGVDQPFAAYHADQLDGVTRIAGSFEPSYESIAAARPDLIIDSALSPGDDRGYELLTAIAPVLAYEPTDWRDYLRAAGTALGREDEAETVVATYDARAAQVREQVAARWAGRTVVSAFVHTGDVIVADRDAQVHRILRDDLGLTLHPLADRPVDDRATLSAETLGDLDADALLIPVYPREDSLERDETALIELDGQPLWRSLPAVSGGAVGTFPGELVYTSPATAAALLEEIATAMA